MLHRKALSGKKPLFLRSSQGGWDCQLMLFLRLLPSRGVKKAFFATPFSQNEPETGKALPFGRQKETHQKWV
jgi:hypothetical protein